MSHTAFVIATIFTRLLFSVTYTPFAHKNAYNWDRIYLLCDEGAEAEETVEHRENIITWEKKIAALQQMKLTLHLV
jgi:hypothetical protein